MMNAPVAIPAAGAGGAAGAGAALASKKLPLA
jgi:hypothetical protein